MATKLVIAFVTLVAVTSCVQRHVRYTPVDDADRPVAAVPTELVEVIGSEPLVPCEELGELLVQEGRAHDTTAEAAVIQSLREAAAHEGCGVVWIRSTSRRTRRGVDPGASPTTDLIKVRATCIRFTEGRPPG